VKSNKIVAILKEQNIEFSSFNILADEEVRNGLKVTISQLKILKPEGVFKLADISTTLYRRKTCRGFGYRQGDGRRGGTCKVTVAPSPANICRLVPTKKDKAQELNDRLKGLINAAPVMLFMKGNPQGPKVV
jgi:hypothetical protein